jgi:hypothetical protein
MLWQLSIRLQGRTFGAPRLTAHAEDSESGREQMGKERPGFNRGVSPCGAGRFAASFGREPCGRGGGPRTASPVTGRLRSPP